MAQSERLNEDLHLFPNLMLALLRTFHVPWYLALWTIPKKMHQSLIPKFLKNKPRDHQYLLSMKTSFKDPADVDSSNLHNHPGNGGSWWQRKTGWGTVHRTAIPRRDSRGLSLGSGP